MNKVILVGRLARDVELRSTQSGTAVASFTVACDRHGVRRSGKRSEDDERLIQPSFCRVEQSDNRKRSSAIHENDATKQTADFISCVAWGKTAEFLSRYFAKGVRIALSGRIETRSWEDNSGNKRYATEVVAEDVEFAQSKSEGSGNFTAPTAPNADVSDFTPIDDEDVPF